MDSALSFDATDGGFRMKKLASVVLLFSALFAPMAGFGAAPRSGTGEKVIIGLPTTSMSMLPVFFAHDRT
jgi:hypothetical protein